MSEKQKHIKLGPKTDEEALKILKDQAQKKVFQHESEPTTPPEVIWENVQKKGKVDDESEDKSST